MFYTEIMDKFSEHIASLPALVHWRAQVTHGAPSGGGGASSSLHPKVYVHLMTPPRDNALPAPQWQAYMEMKCWVETAAGHIASLVDITCSLQNALGKPLILGDYTVRCVPCGKNMSSTDKKESTWLRYTLKITQETTHDLAS